MSSETEYTAAELTRFRKIALSAYGFQNLALLWSLIALVLTFFAHSSYFNQIWPVRMTISILIVILNV